MGFLQKFSTWFHYRDRRAHVRYEIPGLTITHDGVDYTATDWSLGGFKLDDFRATLYVGKKLEGKISLEGGEKGVFSAEIINIDDSGNISVRFLAITPSVFLAMSGLSTM
ncbi:MAG: hypothetical protein GY815_11425 [Gammaproteobacteria bacterium]|nr:hypothetical protein [Gammaproteobacteria bacterium]